MISIFTSQSINYPDGLPSVGIVPSRSFASCVIICFFSFFTCMSIFLRLNIASLKSEEISVSHVPWLVAKTATQHPASYSLNKYSLSELGHRLYSLHQSSYDDSFTTCLTFSKQFISTQSFITRSKTKCRWHLNFLKSVYLGFWRMIEIFYCFIQSNYSFIVNKSEMLTT